MKTSIIITGQISGNYTLKSAISNYHEEKRMMFNCWELIFKTKKEAKKALWEAFKYLRSKEPEFAKYGISYCKFSSLSYDASRAVIQDTY